MEIQSVVRKLVLGSTYGQVLRNRPGSELKVYHVERRGYTATGSMIEMGQCFATVEVMQRRLMGVVMAKVRAGGCD